MITITSAVENALAQDSRTFLVKLWDGSTEVGGSVRALKVNKGSCGAEKFELGAVYSPYITATIDYDGATMDNLNGKELLVQIGVNVGTLDNPDYSYIDIGYFTVIKPQVQGTLVYITAYGRLSLLTDMYPTDSQQTLTQVLSTITTTTGMAVTVKGDLDLTGTVSGLSGWTILETLQIIAGLVGGYVTEDNAGGIVLASYDAYSETDTTRNPATIYVSNDNDFKALPTLLDAETILDGITCYKSIAVGDAGADKFVYGTGIYEYANEYMTQTMFNNMTAKIGGWSHRAGALNMAHGTPILEPWDAVQIIAGGVTFVIPCMSIEIIFDGGIACNVVSAGKTVADEETHFQGALTQRVARTLEVAQEANDLATDAQAKAQEAKTIANNTAQYFWYTGTGSDTGAHITEVPSTDFLQNPSGSNLLARSNGIAVRSGLTELATFGATGAQVGLSSSGHAVLDANGMEVFEGSSSLASFGSTARVGAVANNTSRTEINSTGIDFITRNSSGTDKNLAHIGFDTGQAETGTATAPYYTFGERSGTIGNYSVVMGKNAVIVTEEGEDVIPIEASGYVAYAEGEGTVASGMFSHAEGDQSTASGRASHAEGFGTDANGWYSHAQNYGTVANGEAQTAIGRLNNNKSANAFEVGNGDSTYGRSNALEVGWDGILRAENVLAYGECDSAGNEAYKEVTVAYDDFTLQTGATIAVKFTNANAVANPMLNVNSTGNKPIYRYGTSAPSTSAGSSWSAGSVVALIYDGSAWQMIGWLNTTYSSMTDAEYQAGTSTSARLITPARLKGAIEYWAVPKTGGTMTGQLKTSFNESVAMGSYGASATTVPNLVEELRFSSGCMGSANISTAYTASGYTIATGWYNFIYTPHRNGGENGQAHNDNCDYGNLFLLGMNNTNGQFIIRVANGAIAQVIKLVEENTLANYATTSALGSYALKTDLNSYIKTSTINDYITSQGSTNGWYWRKYKSKKCELWKNVSQTVSAYAQDSFILGSNDTSTTKYPFAITSPITQAYCRKIGTGGGYISYDYDRTDYWSGIAFSKASIAQGTSMAINYSLYVRAIYS